mmetsp:Transcript_12415/g.35284  ORF Transcript_12415/g.35284 Transcript_12415/m.35284 type:complete len:212 (+) Transcript_12415:1338-1973(+)
MLSAATLRMGPAPSSKSLAMLSKDTNIVTDRAGAPGGKWATRSSESPRTMLPTTAFWHMTGTCHSSAARAFRSRPLQWGAKSSSTSSPARLRRETRTSPAAVKLAASARSFPSVPLAKRRSPADRRSWLIRCSSEGAVCAQSSSQVSLRSSRISFRSLMPTLANFLTTASRSFSFHDGSAVFRNSLKVTDSSSLMAIARRHAQRREVQLAE